MTELAADVPLSQACLRLRVSRREGYDLLLTGRLEGHQRRGRWFVLPASLDAEIRRRDSETPAVAATA